MSTPSAPGAREPTTAPPTRGRSTLGTVALVLTAISVVAFVLLIIGSVADWKGFSEDPGDESTAGDVIWSTFAISGLLALIVGIVAWLRGRASRALGDVRAGQVAVGWVVLAILVSIIVSAAE